MRTTRDNAEVLLEHARREVQALSEDWRTVLHIEIERGKHKPPVSVGYDGEGDFGGSGTCDCEHLREEEE